MIKGFEEIYQGAMTVELDKGGSVLCAGAKGSGRFAILTSILQQASNQNAKIYMIDFKNAVKFGQAYKKYGEVITERERALALLKDLVKEATKRLKIFRNLKVKNLGEYNKKTGENSCGIFVFCNKLEEILNRNKLAQKEKKITQNIEENINTLVAIQRQTGINLILGSQRPEMISLNILNKIPIKICGCFPEKNTSKFVLGNIDNINIPTKYGDFIYKSGSEIINFAILK